MALARRSYAERSGELSQGDPFGADPNVRVPYQTRSLPTTPFSHAPCGLLFLMALK